MKNETVIRYVKALKKYTYAKYCEKCDESQDGGCEHCSYAQDVLVMLVTDIEEGN